jgi:transcriptional regulator with XRE-family HTH domain
VNEEGVDALLSGVGPRLTALRRARGMSLRALGRRTGISVSTLSRLETGQRRATLELLLPIARVYEITLDDLIGDQPVAESRPSGEPDLRNEHMVAWRLSRAPGQPAAYKVVFFPDRPERPKELQTHEGWSWCYVLAGQFRAIVGDEDLVLGQGKALEIDTRRPHWTGSARTDAPAELLILFGRQGERIGHHWLRSAAGRR